ncbi:hypothetical protein [Arenibaculum pallidiluteum]|uniref:hypothetical protein n=1 Tax=Arenibaculum pallidiluteum TaxID=2812559 RepID=UPI001A95DE67|nr:hypothetical protein [Arenibaculum pallidiluteum]
MQLELADREPHGGAEDESAIARSLRQLDAARRVSRMILRRRAATIGGATLVYGVWASATGGLALLGLVPLLGALGYAALQLTVPPGRDFREAVRILLLAELGAGVTHRHRPPDAALGPLVSGDGWIVEDYIEGSAAGAGWTLLAARHRDGRGLLVGRTQGDPPRQFAWTLPRPLFAFSWNSPVEELLDDLGRLRSALRALRAEPP